MGTQTAVRFLKRDNAVEYLGRLSSQAGRAERVNAVYEALAADGFWEEHNEWRISTVTSMRIEPVDRSGTRWLKVSVSCDAEMVAHCPTVERAVEFAGIFERLHQDLMWTVGWPSWASREQLSSVKADDGASTGGAVS